MLIAAGRSSPSWSQLTVFTELSRKFRNLQRQLHTDYNPDRLGDQILKSADLPERMKSMREKPPETSHAAEESKRSTARSFRADGTYVTGDIPGSPARECPPRVMRRRRLSRKRHPFPSLLVQREVVPACTWHHKSQRLHLVRFDLTSKFVVCWNG
jgi:hypothetical protein